jgi:hypothetical protein
MENLITDIQPREIFSAYVNAPFDKGKEILEEAGYHIISLQENARLRMQEGKDADISKYGNWVREGVLYVPEKGIFLTKDSPVMANPKEATKCYKNRKDFYLTNEQVEQSLEDSVELIGKSIPTNRFGEDKITVYAFGEDAKRYGEFLYEAGINEMPVWLTDIQDKPFARQMWVCGLGDHQRSGLNGNRGLGNSYRVRGVQDSAEGTAKSFEAHTPTQMQKALESSDLQKFHKVLP